MSHDDQHDNKESAVKRKKDENNLLFIITLQLTKNFLLNRTILMVIIL